MWCPGAAIDGPWYPCGTSTTSPERTSSSTSIGRSGVPYTRWYPKPGVPAGLSSISK